MAFSGPRRHYILKGKGPTWKQKATIELGKVHACTKGGGEELGRGIGRRTEFSVYFLKGHQTGVFQTGGFPDLDFFVLFCPFLSFPDFSGIFPICSGTVRGLSRFVPFLSLGLLGAPTRNSPERVRDTIWTFPEKSGKPPGLETRRFSFSQFSCFIRCAK